MVRAQLTALAAGIGDADPGDEMSRFHLEDAAARIAAILDAPR